MSNLSQPINELMEEYKKQGIWVPPKLIELLNIIDTNTSANNEITTLMLKRIAALENKLKETQ